MISYAIIIRISFYNNWRGLRLSHLGAIGNSINNHLRPFDWYKEFFVTRVIQNQLPADYISQLQSIACVSNPDGKRRLKNYSILSSMKYYFVTSSAIYLRLPVRCFVRRSDLLSSKTGAVHQS